jgi:hypothetical protein
MAETGTGAVPMLPLGRVQQSGDALTITFESGTWTDLAWADLLKASRIFAVVVTRLPEPAVRTMRVWLWRGPRPSGPDWIDITGPMTPLGDDHGYRIAFRDFSGEPALQRWARGDANVRPAILTVHPHDNGFAIGLAPQRAIGTPFSVGVGAPESVVYAIRFGR